MNSVKNINRIVNLHQPLNKWRIKIRGRHVHSRCFKLMLHLHANEHKCKLYLIRIKHNWLMASIKLKSFTICKLQQQLRLPKWNLVHWFHAQYSHDEERKKQSKEAYLSIDFHLSLHNVNKSWFDKLDIRKKKILSTSLFMCKYF